jgi:hypothetical protein
MNSGRSPPDGRADSFEQVVSSPYRGTPSHGPFSPRPVRRFLGSSGKGSRSVRSPSRCGGGAPALKRHPSRVICSRQPSRHTRSAGPKRAKPSSRSRTGRVTRGPHVIVAASTPLTRQAVLAKSPCRPGRTHSRCGPHGRSRSWVESIRGTLPRSIAAVTDLDLLTIGPDGRVRVIGMLPDPRVGRTRRGTDADHVRCQAASGIMSADGSGSHPITERAEIENVTWGDLVYEDR